MKLTQRKLRGGSSSMRKDTYRCPMEVEVSNGGGGVQWRWRCPMEVEVVRRSL